MNEIHVRRLSAVLFLIVAIVIGCLVGAIATAKVQHTVPLFVSTQPNGGGGGQVSFQDGFAPVVEKVLPAVVNISSTKVVKVPGGNPGILNDPFFRQFFGRDFGGRQQEPQQQREHSLGSGVIVSPDGYILTNNHVIEEASDIRIALPDRRNFKGRLVGADPKTDLALVKIETSGLPTVTMDGAAKVRTGQFVLAIGDPFGVGETVTMGIVSATGRGGLGIENYEDFIQTDAAINPGNSGGALINVNGQLIGINTAILTGGGSGNQGVGFAIPVSMAQSVMQQLLKNGKVTRGWLGVGIQPLTPELAAAFGLNQNKGALISNVEPDSPATRAGLQKGDIVIQLNGQAVDDARALSLAVAQMAPNANVKLTILRNGKQQDVTATLGEAPARTEQAEKPGSSEGSTNALSGMSVDDLTPNIAQELNLPSGTQGVVIANVAGGTPAAEAGLQRGDVIQEVNRKPVHNVNDFNNAIRQAGGNKPVLLLVNHGGQTGYVAIQPQ